MLKAIFNWFTGKPLPNTEAPKVSAEAAAPYKIETPVAPAPTVNWPFPHAEQATKVEEMKPAVKAKSARNKKAPVAAMTATAKPAKEKKPARPRAKKAPKA